MASNDFVISTNLIVFGMSTFTGGQTFDGQMIVDLNSAEALLVRQDGDSGDVFIVNTNTPSATLPQANSFISLGPNASATGDIRFGNTRFIAWRNMNNNGDVQALSVDEDDFLNIGSAAALQARILSPSFVALNVGPHSIGGSLGNHRQLRLAGNFVSGGQGTSATNFHMETDLTGFSGDTNFLAGFAYQGAITTQAVAESITNVSGMHLDEPFITDNLTGGGVITNAQTLLITGAPAEGINNFVLRSTGNAPSLFVGAQFVIGRSTVQDFVQFRLGGSFTSGGGSNSVTGAMFASGLTSASGDLALSHIRAGITGGGSLVTSGAGDSVLAATLWLDEPNITLTVSDAMALAATLYISGAPTEGTSANYALFIDNGDARFDGSVQMFANSTFPNPANTFTFGSGVAQTHTHVAIIGAFTSSGISNHAERVFIGGSLTGFNADTLSLAGLLVDASITTQAGPNTITDVAQVIIQEPNITIGAGDTVTNASTLALIGSPTEGTNNFSIRSTGPAPALFAGLQFVIGTTTVLDRIQFHLTGSFTSGGSSTDAQLLALTSTLIGAPGDTGFFAGAYFNSNITTQTATESIADVSQVRIDEPNIVDNLTGSIASAQTLFLVGSPTEGTANFTLRSTGAAPTMFQGLQFVIGDFNVDDWVQVHIGGTFTSGGSSTSASKLLLDGTIIGASGDTSDLAGAFLAARITTQTETESIANVSGVHIVQPNIIDNLTGDITNAQTLLLNGSPTQGVANFVLRANGVAPTMFQGLQFVIGDFAVDDFVQVLISGAFTSGGSSTVAAKLSIEGSLTGFSGDTGRLVGADFDATITTQAVAEVIVDVAQVRIDEPTITLGAGSSITNAQSLLIVAAPTEGVNNYALRVASGDVILGGNLTVSGAGPHSIAGVTFGAVQLLIGSTFTSDGASDIAAGLFHTPAIVGAPGDTSALTGTTLTAGITTQTATESIANIAQLQVNEPFITDNLTGDITQASTVLITGAPTEGLSNFAIRVISGDVSFGGNILIGGDGPHGYSSGITVDYSQSTFAGSFTSGGAFNQASGTLFASSVTSDIGDGALAQVRMRGDLTTPGGGATPTVATLMLDEPALTVGGGDAVSTAATLIINSAPTEGTSNHALLVSSGGVRFNGTLDLRDDVFLSAGQTFTVGSGIVQNFAQIALLGTFTSSGSSNKTAALHIETTQTAVAGDTLLIAALNIEPLLVTQGATEGIANVASVIIDEPNISVGTGDTITVASTLLILAAPTEGSDNYALRVVSGATFLGGELEHAGSTLGFFGTSPTTQPAAYTRNATIVEDRTLLASASATALNNNNVLAALIADLQSLGVIG
jgi:hypothetical protein